MAKVTIMDGGMGRQLKDMGAPFQRPEWSALALMQAPEFVEKAHQQFVDAGAEIIISNSYAVVPFHIGEERFEKNGRDLIKLAASIARKVADSSNRKIKVAGSLPPAFGSYRPDLFIEEKATDIYIPLIEEQDNDVDFWLAETVSSTKEIIKIADILKNNNKPLWVAYTLRDRSNRDLPTQLRSGETIETAVQTALDLGIKHILFNCSQPEEMLPALEIIKKMNIDISYGVYANAFEPIKRDQQANNEETTVRDDTTPEYYLAHAQQWKSLGATIIGGCCGINPNHIKALQSLNK